MLEATSSDNGKSLKGLDPRRDKVKVAQEEIQVGGAYYLQTSAGPSPFRGFVTKENLLFKSELTWLPPGFPHLSPFPDLQGWNPHCIVPATEQTAWRSVDLQHIK